MTLEIHVDIKEKKDLVGTLREGGEKRNSEFSPSL